MLSGFFSLSKTNLLLLQTFYLFIIIVYHFNRVLMSQRFVQRFLIFSRLFLFKNIFPFYVVFSLKIALFLIGSWMQATCVRWIFDWLLLSYAMLLYGIFDVSQQFHLSKQRQWKMKIKLNRWAHWIVSIQ